ncbi:MAG: sulfatase-like hydrolase/transferase, partial [Chitinivibrionales bacterium]|nr:sulfatase-like hydrolase/transferase [Chitinivibrionales bacterium]MBD3358136.1 sulfatase-like hydrolase/transferase [Chitinivibrionales bacterium]
MAQRREVLTALGLGAVGAHLHPQVFSLCGAFQKKNKTPKKPNIVFILADDLGWSDLSCYGGRFYETPNLDDFAQTGVRFTDAYASCPVCSPTRASVMTGKYPARFNITDWIPGMKAKNRKLITPQDLQELPLDEVTFAERLKESGYKTFFAGKWHLGGEGFYPQDQGFDINKGGYHKGGPRGGYYSPYKNPALDDGPDGEYLTDRLTDESIKFMEANKNTPFVLCLSFYTVHTPIQACNRHHLKFPKKKAEKMHGEDKSPFRRERRGVTKMRQDNPSYASMVHAMDENIGRLLAKLEKLGLDDNTAVIFTSDNGSLSTRAATNAPTSNLPLRAGKGWCYEGGIRVPAIMRLPGVTKPNSTCRAPITSTDFYPTFLDLAGLPQNPKQHADGLSLIPLFDKKVKTLARNAIYWHYPHYHGSTWTPGAAIRYGDWKLIEFYEEGEAELYNLASDIGESKDLSDAYP